MALAPLCYNSFTESYPVYLPELLSTIHPDNFAPFLTQKPSAYLSQQQQEQQKSFWQRAFAFTGPTQWNSLQYGVRHSASTASFRQRCNIPLYIFVFAVYVLVVYMCAQIRFWSCLVTDDFGLYTKIAVCKFLRGLVVVYSETILFCPLYVSIHFSASFCTAHCALDFARDHAP